MSGAGSRRKGANYERRTARILSDRLGIDAERKKVGVEGDDLSHSWESWLSIECKDRAASSLGAWVDQAVEQAGPDRLAVVVHHRRGNGRPERDFVTMTVADFVVLAELAFLARQAVELDPIEVDR